MGMKTFGLSGIALLSLVTFVGCQDAENDIEASAEQATNEVSEAASDAADAVTPDEPIVDIKTPLGNVKVGNDPKTGQTNVDVDSPRADVDVSSGE